MIKMTLAREVSRSPLCTTQIIDNNSS
jgi:hypothetical protein